MEKNENYDKHGSASHYDSRINFIHILINTWGAQSVMEFCEMNALKYRMRIGKKDNIEQELKKIKWYETMAKYLKNQRDNTFGIGPGEHPLFPEFIKMLEDGK